MNVQFHESKNILLSSKSVKHIQHDSIYKEFKMRQNKIIYNLRIFAYVIKL